MQYGIRRADCFSMWYMLVGMYVVGSALCCDKTCHSTAGTVNLGVVDTDNGMFCSKRVGGWLILHTSKVRGVSIFEVSRVGMYRTHIAS